MLDLSVLSGAQSRSVQFGLARPKFPEYAIYLNLVAMTYQSRIVVDVVEPPVFVQWTEVIARDSDQARSVLRVWRNNRANLSKLDGKGVRVIDFVYGFKWSPAAVVAVSVKRKSKEVVAVLRAVKD